MGNPTISQTFSVNISVLFYKLLNKIHMFRMRCAAAGSSNVVHTGIWSFIQWKNGISDFRKQFFTHDWQQQLMTCHDGIIAGMQVRNRKKFMDVQWKLRVSATLCRFYSKWTFQHICSEVNFQKSTFRSQLPNCIFNVLKLVYILKSGQ